MSWSTSVGCFEKPESGTKEAAESGGGNVGCKLVHFDGLLMFTTEEIMLAKLILERRLRRGAGKIKHPNLLTKLTVFQDEAAVQMSRRRGKIS
jgi:hypothetical protein